MRPFSAWLLCLRGFLSEKETSETSPDVLNWTRCAHLVCGSCVGEVSVFEKDASCWRRVSANAADHTHSGSDEHALRAIS